MNPNPKQSEQIRRSGAANFAGIIALLVLVVFHPLLGISIPFVWLVLLTLAAILLTYASATVIIASRDLERYGSIIIYEALLRFAAAVLLIFASFFFGWWGILVFAIGLTDLFWALAYCVIVPQATGRSIKQLLALTELPESSTPAQSLATTTPDEETYTFKI